MRRLSTLALASLVLLVAAPGYADEFVVPVNVTTSTTWTLTISSGSFALKPDVTAAAIASGTVWSEGGVLATLSSNGAVTMQVPTTVVMSHQVEPSATLTASVPVFVTGGDVTRTSDANYSYLQLHSPTGNFIIKGLLTQVPADSPAGIYQGSIVVTVYATE